MSLNRKDVKPGGSVFSIFVVGKAKGLKVSFFSFRMIGEEGRAQVFSELVGEGKRSSVAAQTEKI